MKLFTVVLLCSTIYLTYAATTAKPEDYRDKYDHLLMQVIDERIRNGERFVEHLSQQLVEYETTKKPETREHILREITFILPMVKGIEGHFEVELKKTGLDAIERYATERARDEAQLIIKTLGEIQAAVGAAPKPATKAPLFFAETAKPVDYRNEYDRLLFQTIQEHIGRADGLLLGLNRQLQEYQKSKSADVKARIVAEVEGILPLLRGAEGHATTELKRTDLNDLERFLYEKSHDQILLLIKHYTQIEAAVKAPALAFEYFAATAAPVDWRAEYDRLLFETIEGHIRRGDFELLRLQREFNEYQQTKNKEIVDRIVREVDFTLPLIKGAQTHAVTELKRADLNQVERYLYEKVNDEATLLIKHFTALEKAVKPKAFYELEGEYYAPSNRSVEVREAEAKFLSVSHAVREYFVSKAAEEKTRLISEIESELTKVKALGKDLETDLLASHGILERFHVEGELRLIRAVEVGYAREEARLKAA